MPYAVLLNPVEPQTGVGAAAVGHILVKELVGDLVVGFGVGCRVGTGVGCIVVGLGVEVGCIVVGFGVGCIVGSGVGCIVVGFGVG